MYVPDLFAATNPGEYSGIVISQAGYYKITTQMYFFEPSPATRQLAECLAGGR